jgi:ketosteroid isomerase-like protein
MRPRSLLALALLIPAGTLAAQEPLDWDPAAVELEIVPLIDLYGRAFNDRDTVTIRGMYVDDERFSWYEDGRLRYRNADDILRAIRNLGDMDIRTQWLDRKVVPLSPTLASLRLGFVTRINLSNGTEMEFRGVQTMVVERTSGGWRIVNGHTSTVRPDNWGR